MAGQARHDVKAASGQCMSVTAGLPIPALGCFPSAPANLRPLAASRLFFILPQGPTGGAGMNPLAPQRTTMSRGCTGHASGLYCNRAHNASTVVCWLPSTSWPGITLQLPLGFCTPAKSWMYL